MIQNSELWETSFWPRQSWIWLLQGIYECTDEHFLLLWIEKSSKCDTFSQLKWDYSHWTDQKVILIHDPKLRSVRNIILAMTRLNLIATGTISMSELTLFAAITSKCDTFSQPKWDKSHSDPCTQTLESEKHHFSHDEFEFDCYIDHLNVRIDTF